MGIRKATKFVLLVFILPVVITAVFGTLFTNYSEKEVPKQEITIIDGEDNIEAIETQYLAYAEFEDMETSKNIMITRLKGNSHYLQLFMNDWRYIIETNSSFGISYQEYCYKRGFYVECVVGQWDYIENFMIIYTNVADDDYNLIFGFLHEIGHLLFDFYANDTEIEWMQIHNSSEEFIREYSTNDYQEDFADSYAAYRMGELIPEEKKQFIERIIKEASYG